MNVARPADGLLPASQTITLLGLIARARDGISADKLTRDLAASRAASHSRAHNSIVMLESAGLLERDGHLLSCPLRQEEEWRDLLSNWVASAMALRMTKTGPHALHTHANQLMMDSLHLPGPVDGLRLWLLEFGVATRSGSTSRHWTVSEDFRFLFLQAAEAWNRRPGRHLSQAGLDARLQRQADEGARAEIWVLQRERTRLEEHPLVHQVERVSINNVSAGYDIISFSDLAVLTHDRYLEIKSYVGKRRFFWSSGEIAEAKRLGENYHLYIVDRNRMEHTGYEPEIISGPYRALFETEGNGWSIVPSTYECVAID